MQNPQLSAGHALNTSFDAGRFDHHSSENRTYTKSKRFSNPLDRFKANPTRKYAIYALCYECMGSGGDTSWKTDIGNCQIKDCPVWSFRPYQNRYKNDYVL